MATLAAPVPGLADGDGGLRAPGAARRRALPRRAGRRTRRRRAGRKRPAVRRRPWPPGRTCWRAGSSLVVTATRENDIRRALALADEFKVKVAVAGAPQARRVADLIKARKLPLLVSVNFDPPAAGDLLRRRGRGARSGATSRRRRRTPPRCTRPGVPFALVSGHAPDFLAGVRKAIERGPAARRRRCARSRCRAAEALGVADRTGQPGGGQDRQRGGLVGRAADQGREGEDGVRGRRALRAGRQAAAPARAPRPARTPTPEVLAMTARWPAPLLALLAAAAGARRPPTRRSPSSAAPSSPSGPQGTIPNGHRAHPRRQDRRRRRRTSPCPPGAPRDRRHRPVRDARASSTPTRTPRSRGASTSARTSVTAEVRVADVIDHRDVNIYRAARRRRHRDQRAARLLQRDRRPERGDQAALGPGRRRSCVFKEAPRGIKFALGENPKRVELPRARARRAIPATRMGVEVVLREAFREAQAYRREWEDYERKVKAAAPRASGRRRPGATCGSRPLRDILDGKVLVHAHCYRADEILMLIRAGRRVRLQDPHVPARARGLQGGERDRAPRRRAPPPSPTGGPTRSRPATPSPTTRPSWPPTACNVSLNSDSDELARRLYWEAAKAVKYGGVSEDEALKMITLNPAWQLGVDKRVGSIEAGQGRRHRDLQRPSLLARRARGDDAGGGNRALRPRAGPGRATRRRRRREVAR